MGQEGAGGLDDLGARRLALMDESGVGAEVLSVTTRALPDLEPEERLARYTAVNWRCSPSPTDSGVIG
jgi:hypothetical protein